MCVNGRLDLVYRYFILIKVCRMTQLNSGDTVLVASMEILGLVYLISRCLLVPLRNINKYGKYRL